MPDDALLTLAELSGFPEASSLSEGVVAAAGTMIRNYCGWRIAPAKTETLTVETHGGCDLSLPRTLHLTSVSEIRDITSDPAGALVTDYRTAATERFRAGILTRPCGWPWEAVLEVDVTHGYDTCPDDLKGVAYSLAQLIVQNPKLASRTTGPFSETYLSALSREEISTLDHYRLP